MMIMWSCYTEDEEKNWRPLEFRLHQLLERCHRPARFPDLFYLMLDILGLLHLPGRQNISRLNLFPANFSSFLVAFVTFCRLSGNFRVERRAEVMWIRLQVPDNYLQGQLTSRKPTNCHHNEWLHGSEDEVGLKETRQDEIFPPGITTTQRGG